MRCSLDDLKISCRKIYGGIAGVILDGHARFLFFALHGLCSQGIPDAFSLSAVQFVVRCKMR
jgi:hypothetical protein